jgi:hypothetical protein
VHKSQVEWACSVFADSPPPLSATRHLYSHPWWLLACLFLACLFVSLFVCLSVLLSSVSCSCACVVVIVIQVVLVIIFIILVVVVMVGNVVVVVGLLVLLFKLS